MNYSAQYNKLINRAKNRILTEGYERHHIIPRCMGGSDDPSNIANLTPEEHYVAHQLLVKLYPENTKLIFAVKMMIPANKYQVGRKNKLYGWLRRKVSIAQKSKIPSQLGTMWVNDGTKNKKIKKSDPIEPGWVKGRIFNDSFKGFSYINSLPNQGHHQGQQKDAASVAGKRHKRMMETDSDYRNNWVQKQSKNKKLI